MEKEAFKPKQGQIDYTNARWAPVINCVVRYKDKMLVVQRNKTINFYPNYWNGVAGFLDDQRSLHQKVSDELKEELGIPKSKIKNITCGEIFDQEAPKYKKTWIVHPILVDVTTNKIILDWEAQGYKWVTLQEAKELKLLPGFDKVLEKLSKYIQEK